MVRIILLFLSILFHPNGSYGQDVNNNVEESVCGWLEPIVFWFWSGIAGKPPPSPDNAEAISFKTQDGKTLHGYRIPAKENGRGSIVPKGYVLIAQGNAMRADQLIHDMLDFAVQGYDVYIYDYRGYGNSEGKPRIKAIVRDYIEIASELAVSGYKRQLLYGISMGGIVVLKVISSGIQYDAAAIDSVPSRISTDGCPKEYDPINNMPSNGSKLLFISGEQDNILPPEKAREILDTAMRTGSSVVISKDFKHPFYDKDPIVFKRRLTEIRNFLLKE